MSVMEMKINYIFLLYHSVTAVNMPFTLMWYSQKHRLWSQTSWDQIPALLIIGHISLGELPTVAPLSLGLALFWGS